MILDGEVVFTKATVCPARQNLSDIFTGWPRHRENREFGSYFFQTGKTQGICQKILKI